MNGDSIGIANQGSPSSMDMYGQTNYFLRVLPTLKHSSALVSDIPSGSIYRIISPYLFCHSIGTLYLAFSLFGSPCSVRSSRQKPWVPRVLRCLRSLQLGTHQRRQETEIFLWRIQDVGVDPQSLAVGGIIVGQATNSFATKGPMPWNQRLVLEFVRIFGWIVEAKNEVPAHDLWVLVGFYREISHKTPQQKYLRWLLSKSEYNCFCGLPPTSA